MTTAWRMLPSSRSRLVSGSTCEHKCGRASHLRPTEHLYDYKCSRIENSTFFRGVDLEKLAFREGLETPRMQALPQIVNLQSLKSNQ